MRICKHEEPEKRQPTATLSPLDLPTLPAVVDQAGDEAQWADYLAELLLRTEGESASGCDWTDGALTSGGCRW